MANLATVYGVTKRHSDKLALLERVVDPFAKIHGAGHPTTLGCMSNLATAYIDTDRHSDAIPLLQRVIFLQTKPDSLRHSDRLIYLANLAKLATAYSCTDRQNEAIPLLEMVVKIRTKVLGAGHPNTMSTVDKLEGIRNMQRSNARISIA